MSCCVCRQQLKLSVKLAAENSSELLQNMAVDLLVSGQVNQMSTCDKDVDAITLDSVNEVQLFVLCYQLSR